MVTAQGLEDLELCDKVGCFSDFSNSSVTLSY